MSTVTRLNNDQYVGISQDNSLNYFDISGRDANKDSTQRSESFHNWAESTINIGDFEIIPNGSSNDIPKKIQEATLPNSLAPRIQNRKSELLIDQGTYLYEECIEGNNIVRKPVKNDKIKKWLESFQHNDQVIENSTNYYYSNIVFNKVFRNRGARLSSSSATFSKIESVSSFDARLAYRKSSTTKIPTHVVVGDWYSSSSNTKDFDVYPIFNALDPYKHAITIHIAAFKSYGMKHYPLPEIYGALPWIERNTTIPKILKSLTDNSLNIKWHITSPDIFWEAQKKKLEQQCKDQKITYKDKMLEDLRQKIFTQLTNLLSGVENVGKFWHSVEVTKIIGSNANKIGWEIKPIEQKIKDYVKAQLEIAFASAKAVLAALGLHSALANVGADGKSDSGSEQIYAYKIHQATSTRLPEYYVLKAFNDIIKIKFKGDVKLGFLKAEISTESETTPPKRLINTTGQ